ncbi:PotD/PotF family extracellular solute-binding protein [Bradyrhizobium sp. CCBAU 51765]|uniref:ABC transporter substrate-binding protein n=1 Tax=Bradyrhizobium sp. CCBAU 51765 TaxID=1325102 RepID=UPI0018871165|nr:signal peptide prediction [Bradyrhizobium sp. CCBAU 51765]QOZ08099.1 signal peptide prediction [Bradyrhizobium sp. CCBAU 51765]
MSRPRLRVIARREFVPEPLKAEAARALDIDIVFDVVDTLDGLRRVVTAPETFDVYHQWHTIDLIWTSRAIQPIALDRLTCAAALRAISRPPLNALSPPTVTRKLFLQADGELGSAPSGHVSMLPVLRGVDCFAYQPAVRDLIGADVRESWGWLFDDRLRGHVGLLSDPVLGMIEAALATEASRNISFDDIGNLSIEDIDLVADALIQLKKLGHFRGVWSNYEEAARLMQRGALVQSMFTPGATRLRREKLSVIIASPIEGGRGWHSDLCISSATHGKALDAAYAYLNWWAEGWPSACLSRQGYYAFFPERARSYLEQDEWDYWYDGLPAARALPDPFGEPAIPVGHVREGGSCATRMGRVRVWNTFMDEHTYLVRRWREFLEA